MSDFETDQNALGKNDSKMIYRLYLVFDKKSQKWILKSPKNTVRQNCLDISTGMLVGGQRVYLDFDQRSEAIRAIHNFKFTYMVFVKDLKHRGFMFSIRNDLHKKHHPQVVIGQEQPQELKEDIKKEFVGWRDLDIFTAAGELAFARHERQNRLMGHVEEMVKSLGELLKLKRSETTDSNVNINIDTSNLIEYRAPQANVSDLPEPVVIIEEEPVKKFVQVEKPSSQEPQQEKISDPEQEPKPQEVVVPKKELDQINEEAIEEPKNKNEPASAQTPEPIEAPETIVEEEEEITEDEANLPKTQLLEQPVIVDEIKKPKYWERLKMFRPKQEEETSPSEELIISTQDVSVEALQKTISTPEDYNPANIAISVSGLTKTFANDTGVVNANFEIPRKGFVLLVGPNGAGKTTIIRCLLRLYQEYAGDIRVDGIHNTDVSVFGKISYVNEKPLFPTESLKSYLTWTSKLVGHTDSSTKVLIKKYTEQLGIDKLLNSKPSRFSSGEQQKVLLAKTLIESKPIVIMDEPTSNMDVNTRKSLFKRLKEMNNDGKTILLCTHNVDEVEKYATHMIVVNKGNVVFSGKKPEQEATKFVDQLLGVSSEGGEENAVSSTI